MLIQEWNMGKLTNLHELRFAQKICKDIPKIQLVLDDMSKKCEPYLEYREIGEIHRKLVDSRTILDIQYKHYRTILDNEGVD